MNEKELKKFNECIAKIDEQIKAMDTIIDSPKAALLDIELVYAERDKLNRFKGILNLLHEKGDIENIKYDDYGHYKINGKDETLLCATINPGCVSCELHTRDAGVGSLIHSMYEDFNKVDSSETELKTVLNGFQMMISDLFNQGLVKYADSEKRASAENPKEIISFRNTFCDNELNPIIMVGYAPEIDARELTMHIYKDNIPKEYTKKDELLNLANYISEKISELKMESLEYAFEKLEAVFLDEKPHNNKCAPDEIVM